MHTYMDDQRKAKKKQNVTVGNPLIPVKINKTTQYNTAHTHTHTHAIYRICDDTFQTLYSCIKYIITLSHFEKGLRETENLFAIITIEKIVHSCIRAYTYYVCEQISTHNRDSKR